MMTFCRRLLAGGGMLLATTCPVLPAHADEQGELILKKAYKKFHSAITMTADITTRYEQQKNPDAVLFKGTITAMKPNYLRVTVKGKTATGIEMEDNYASDGKSYFSYTSFKNSYTKVRQGPNPTDFSGPWEGEVDSFFGGEKNIAKVEIEYVGTENVGKEACDIIKTIAKGPGDLTRTITYAISKAESLILRTSIIIYRPDQPEANSVVQTNTLSNIRLNVPRKAAEFQYTPPKGARYEPPPPPPLDRAQILPKSANRVVCLARK